MRLRQKNSEISQGDCFLKRRPPLIRCTMRLSIASAAALSMILLPVSFFPHTNQSAFGQEESDASSDDLTPQPKGESSSNPKETSKESSSTEKSKPPRPQFIDTSIEEKPSVNQFTAPDEKSDEYKEREAKLPEPLKKLIQAPFLYNNSKGGSSELSDAFTEAAKQGPKLREDLQFIFENGSPAGKLYAASLIRLFDAPGGTRLLSGFKADKTLVKNKTYISQEHYTAGEVVTDLLSPAPTILLKPR